jgi:hypothetical protein
MIFTSDAPPGMPVERYDATACRPGVRRLIFLTNYIEPEDRFAPVDRYKLDNGPWAGEEKERKI